MLIVLCGVEMPAHSAQNDLDKTAKSPLNNPAPASDNQSKLSVSPYKNPSSSELFAKMMLMVLLVAVLGMAVIYVSKKVLPRFTSLPAKRIKVVETVHLGPRKTVHLLKVDNQLILVGSTNEYITRLSDILVEPPDENFSTGKIDNI